ALCEPELDDQIPALDIAVLVQAVGECREEGGGARRGWEASENTDPPHLPALLRLGGKGRREESASQRSEERTPVHRLILRVAASSSLRSGQRGRSYASPAQVSAAIAQLRLLAALALAVVRHLHLEPGERPTAGSLATR